MYIVYFVFGGKGNNFSKNIKIFFLFFLFEMEKVIIVYKRLSK